MPGLATLREGCPVTLTGAALGALSVCAFWFLGVGRLDLVLLSASVLVALLVLGLTAATLVAALVLRRRPVQSAGPYHLECGVWKATGYHLALSPLLPFLVLRVAWETPVATQAVLLSGGGEQAFPGRRTRGPGVLRRIRVGDILGLTELGWQALDPAPVTILPSRSPLDAGATFLGLTPGEELPDPRGGPLGDPVEIRKYGHGDPMRMILWKAYARTRKAFVRVPERAVEPAPRLCAYLPSNPWDEPPARLARTLLERGLLGPGWRFGADGAEDAHTLVEALDALAASGVPAQPGLASFLDRARRDGFGACLLLLPAQAGPWIEGIQAALAGSALRIHAVLALEGWRPEPPGPWRRLLLACEPGRGAAPGEVLTILERLGHPDSETTLVDTVSGDALDGPRSFLAKRAGRNA